MHAKQSRREFLRCLGTAGAALFLGACKPTAPTSAPGPGEPVTGKTSEVPTTTPKEKIKLTFWGDFTKHVQGDIINEFNNETPDIEVEALNVPSNPEKLITSVTGGNPPDLFSMDRYLAGEWAARGVIMPVEEFVNTSKIIKKERFYERLLRDVTWRNQMWAVPKGTDCRAFWWNKTIFKELDLDPEKPPTTWAELETCADQITKRNADNKLERLGFSPIAGNPPGFLQFWIYLWQLGGLYLSEDNNKAVFNSQEGVKALEWMVHMTDKYGGIDEIAEFLKPPSLAEGQDIFSMGFLGMQVHGHWMAAQYARYAADLDYGVSGIPIPEGGQRVNYIGGWTWVIPKGVKHPEATFRFIEYNMTDENQLRIALFGGGIPPYEDLAFSDAWLQGDPKREVFANEVKVGRWVPVTPGVSEMFSIQIRVLDEALHHLKTPQEALDQGVKEVQEILDKNKDLREGKQIT